MLRGLKAAAVLIGVFAAFWLWYCIAANYDYDALAGTYTFKGQGVSCKLLLRADQTFHEEVTEAGKTRFADGAWHRSGMSGVDFSLQFIRLPGEKTFVEDHGQGEGGPADLQFYGHFKKVLGIYTELTLNTIYPGPVLYKNPFARLR